MSGETLQSLQARESFELLLRQRLSATALQTTVAPAELSPVQVRGQALFTAIGQTAADTTGDLLRGITGTGAAVSYQSTASLYDARLNQLAA